ncbi:RNA polymerase sigma factor [Mucisphaera calidilacus]|uniref:ECF RNA polymerase sigma factor SigW n=1 Tax=Mucisphaera calidilacus TaxID=2527982 RepID=A0A518BUQ4_9BACT|nr:sigma-70 family RNA polymerase sigma factor [Mucisphaera calidilacus]QDU70667.1 ECF RNA polymerase sigma factor SigW [Mucisphaera calidilacus]
MTHEADAQQLSAIRQGDRTQLADLLRQHQGRLYSLCLRILANPEDAADATQNAMVRIIQNLEQFEGRSRLSTWMSRIAINEGLSLLRRRKARPALRLTHHDDHNNPLALADSREPEPSRRIEEQERSREIALALEELEEHFRVVLVLRDIQAMSYEQIAETTGLAIGTVKSRLFRGRLALRQILDDREATPRRQNPEGSRG